MRPEPVCATIVRILDGPAIGLSACQLLWEHVEWVLKGVLDYNYD